MWVCDSPPAGPFASMNQASRLAWGLVPVAHKVGSPATLPCSPVLAVWLSAGNGPFVRVDPPKEQKRDTRYTGASRRESENRIAPLRRNFDGVR
jgi:hypothetical protein